MTAPEIRRLAGQVSDVGKRVGGIHVSVTQSGNLTATTAISTFVASASSDASSIGQAVGQDADHVAAAATTYTRTDDASQTVYEQLMRNAGGIGP